MKSWYCNVEHFESAAVIVWHNSCENIKNYLLCQEEVITTKKAHQEPVPATRVDKQCPVRKGK
jgi:hypothetical protein